MPGFHQPSKGVYHYWTNMPQHKFLTRLDPAPSSLTLTTTLTMLYYETIDILSSMSPIRYQTRITLRQILQVVVAAPDFEISICIKRM